MTEDLLTDYIDFSLPLLGQSTTNGRLLPMLQMLKSHKNLNTQEALIIVNKFLELGLATSGQKYKSGMRITTKGYEVLAQGGWRAHLALKNQEKFLKDLQGANEAAIREERQRKAELRETANLTLTQKTANAAVNSAIAAWGSVAATLLSALIGIYVTNDQKVSLVRMKTELDSLKESNGRMSSTLQMQTLIDARHRVLNDTVAIVNKTVGLRDSLSIRKRRHLPKK